MYKLENFLMPVSQGDTKLFIKDSDGKITHSIEVFSIRSSRAINNVIKIITSSKTISLGFSTTNEARVGLEEFQKNVDILRNNVPLYVDRGIENYIKSFVFGGGIPYTYSSSLSGDPGEGKISFNSPTASHINRSNISFTDNDGIAHGSLINMVLVEGATLLLRYVGGSLIVKIKGSLGGFGVYAETVALYVSGEMPQNGANILMTVSLGLPNINYVARLTQSGGSEPTPTILLDQTGYSFFISYIDVGTYHLTSDGKFIDGTTAQISNSDIENKILSAHVEDESTIIIKSANTSFVLTDSLIQNDIISISIPQIETPL